MKNLLAAQKQMTIDMHQVFSGAPLIYVILSLLSALALGLWIYSLLSLRKEQIEPHAIRTRLAHLLKSGAIQEALALCHKERSLYTDLLALSLETKNGADLREILREEGQRITRSFWQKVGFMGDIAAIAPMLGLLGTVLGMFYAFYDLNRSNMSLSSLFDGLGVSVGTTVAGLIVSLFAMALYISLKYRLVKRLSHIENEIIETMRSV